MQTIDKHIYRLIVLLAALTLSTGTIFYHLDQGWSWLDSYYFSVVTLSTVGYGDFVPTKPGAKIFTTIYIFVGVGILTTFITATMKRQGKRIQEKHDIK